MSIFSRVAGAVASFFQFGGPNGPGLNDNAGALEAKNSTNTGFVNLRAADPVLPNDTVTLEYLQQTYPNIATQKVLYFNGQNIPTNAPIAGNSYWGWNTFLSTAVNIGHPVLTPGTRLSATNRFIASAGISSQLGIRESGQLIAWRGNAAGLGGFTFRCRFALESIGTNTTMFAMVGLISNLNPVATTNFVTDMTIAKVGMAFSATSVGNVLSGNWQLLEGTVGAITAHDLGVGFPLIANQYLELILASASDGTSITYTVNNLTTGATTSGTLNTSIPINTQFLCPYLQCNTQTGASPTTSFSISNVVLVCFDG